MKTFSPLLIICLFLFSCKDQTYVYEVNDVEANQENTIKDKEKTTDQFLSILYINLFQEALSPNQLVETTEVVTTTGDTEVAYETAVAKFISNPDVKMPTNGEMRGNVEQFVINTYKHFFVRTPTEAEKTFFINFIESHPNVTPEHIFIAFANSNEVAHH